MRKNDSYKKVKKEYNILSNINYIIFATEFFFHRKFLQRISFSIVNCDEFFFSSQIFAKDLDPLKTPLPSFHFHLRAMETLHAKEERKPH